MSTTVREESEAKQSDIRLEISQITPEITSQTSIAPVSSCALQADPDLRPDVAAASLVTYEIPEQRFSSEIWDVTSLASQFASKNGNGKSAPETPTTSQPRGLKS
jgi:hypothetical protein